MLAKIILALSILVTSTILAAAKPVPTELEARAGDVVLRIASTECTNKTVLEALKPEYHSKFRKAEIRHAGKPVNGCWTMDANGIYVMFEDGSQGYVPPELFKPVQTL